jgi:DNA-binding NarL/FixJ family response regulator
MIVTDWNLPGRPLAAILNEIKSTHHPKIIILTTEKDDIPSAQEIGADALVSKGASPDVLLKVFQQVRIKQSRRSIA